MARLYHHNKLWIRYRSGLADAQPFDLGGPGFCGFYHARLRLYLLGLLAGGCWRAIFSKIGTLTFLPSSSRMCALWPSMAILVFPFSVTFGVRLRLCWPGHGSLTAGL